MTRIDRRRRYLPLIAAVAALSPFTISDSGRIQSVEACADGTCCPEDKSICFINDIRTDDSFYKGSDSCIQPY